MNKVCLKRFLDSGCVPFRDLGQAYGVCGTWRSAIVVAATLHLRTAAVQLGCSDGDWPLVDATSDPRQMFNPSTESLLAKLGHAGGANNVSEFFAAWHLVISLPYPEINEINADGTSLLSSMLTVELDHIMVDRHMNRLISRVAEQLDQTVLRSEVDFGMRFPGFCIPSPAPAICLALRGKKRGRMSRSSHSGKVDLLAVLPETVLESCFVPSLIFPDTRDNILQYILEPCHVRHSSDKQETEARLCRVVAQRFRLVDHIHRNTEGICALSYAEQFVNNTGPLHDAGAWVRVRDTITERMLEGCHDLRSRSDDESFSFLTYVAQELKAAMESARHYEYEVLQQTHLSRVVRAFEAAEMQRADEVRLQWLANGWRFRHGHTADQHAEVLQHYRARQMAGRRLFG